MCGGGGSWQIHHCWQRKGHAGQGRIMEEPDCPGNGSEATWPEHGIWGRKGWSQAGVCWDQPILESGTQCSVVRQDTMLSDQAFSVLVAITLVTWNQPRWELLHLPLELADITYQGFPTPPPLPHPRQKSRASAGPDSFESNRKTVVPGSSWGGGVAYFFFFFEWINE